MADFHLAHRPALGPAVISETGAIAIEAMPEGRVLHVLGKPDEDLGPVLAELAADPGDLRWAGPGQWFIVGDTPISPAEFRSLEAKIQGRAFLVDQSHGRVRIRLRGTRVADVLAKGTGLDVDSMADGESAMTLMGHISVHLTRLAPDAFELMVTRSFAESLWEDLLRMSREFL